MRNSALNTATTAASRIPDKGALSQITSVLRRGPLALVYAARRGLASSLLLPAALIPLLLASPSRAEERPAPDAAQLAKARASIKGLGENLKQQLMAAIKEGGPIAAVNVCRTIAPAIAEEQSHVHGVKVGRTALKVRNPGNAPDAFERRVLEDFVRQIAEGADPAKLEHAEIVSDGDGRVLRYMKAIPMAAQPCAICHGAELSPALKAEIAKLYPDDQATGFKPGELRGAFTATEKLN
ncbi:Tll0287-like domain-containing protein [Hyphomicrobium sp. 1Nfss2.1]|uniref:Tll0287-like domain-containing protein n=1 Tax=Hyphomicrobium sp. 1Nfss2.1 TaxID=3413936 RepID=UPI003C7BFFEB